MAAGAIRIVFAARLVYRIPMTMIVGVAARSFALLMTDTRAVAPPGSGFQVVGGPKITISGSKPVNIDGFGKSVINHDGTDIFAFSGDGLWASGFLSELRQFKGLAGNDALFRKFEERAALHNIGQLQAGEYDTQGGLHVFRADDRFMVSRFECSPMHVHRCVRRGGSANGTVGIEAMWSGSGGGVLSALLTHLGVQTEYEAIRSADEVQPVHAFFTKMFHAAAVVIPSEVNTDVRTWIATADAPKWRAHAAG